MNNVCLIGFNKYRGFLDIVILNPSTPYPGICLLSTGELVTFLWNGLNNLKKEKHFYVVYEKE